MRSPEWPPLPRGSDPRQQGVGHLARCQRVPDLRPVGQLLGAHGGGLTALPEGHHRRYVVTSAATGPAPTTQAADAAASSATQLLVGFILPSLDL